MCRFCCSHTQLSLPQTCHSQTLYHVALFPLRYNGTLFPGSEVILDVYVVNYQRLFLELRTGLHRELHLSEAESELANAQLLCNTFAVAPSTDSSVGALVTATKIDQGIRREYCYTRVRALVVGRYSRVGEVYWHAPYPCIMVSLICEKPSIRVDVDEMFPYASPVRRRNAGVMTRRAKAASVRKRLWTGAVRFSDWYAHTPEVLLERAKRKAMYARLEMDELTTPPTEGDCVSRWSFWLCACLPQDVGDEILMDLLAEQSVVERLVKLIAVLEKVQMRRKRKKGEEAYRASPGKRPRVERRTESFVTSREEQVVLPVWPEFKDGFSKFDRRCPVRGRFQEISPTKIAPYKPAVEENSLN